MEVPITLIWDLDELELAVAWALPPPPQSSGQDRPASLGHVLRVRPGNLEMTPRAEAHGRHRPHIELGIIIVGNGHVDRRIGRTGIVVAVAGGWSRRGGTWRCRWRCRWMRRRWHAKTWADAPDRSFRWPPPGDVKVVMGRWYLVTPGLARTPGVVVVTGRG